MSFLVILLSLVAERLMLPYRHLRRAEWIGGWLEWQQSRPVGPALREGPAALALLLLPLALTVAVVGLLIGDGLWGLIGLAFSVLVLLYCLGPEDLDERVGRLVDACEQADVGRIDSCAADFVDPAGDARDEGFSRRVAEGILEQSLRGTFGVLFWFLVLGPAGAVLYRGSVEIARHGREQSRHALADLAEQWLWLLDWLPSRLMAGLFALAGCFESAVDGWRHCEPTRGPHAARTLLGCAGGGALQLGTLIEDDAGPDPFVFEAALGLVWRALAMLVALLGLITLAGWLS